MPDVHLLRDIRRRELDDRLLALPDRRVAPEGRAPRPRLRNRLTGKTPRFDREIHKPALRLHSREQRIPRQHHRPRHLRRERGRIPGPRRIRGGKNRKRQIGGNRRLRLRQRHRRRGNQASRRQKRGRLRPQAVIQIRQIHAIILSFAGRHAVK